MCLFLLVGIYFHRPRDFHVVSFAYTLHVSALSMHIGPAFVLPIPGCGVKTISYRWRSVSLELAYPNFKGWERAAAARECLRIYASGRTVIDDAMYTISSIQMFSISFPRSDRRCNACLMSAPSSSLPNYPPPLHSPIAHIAPCARSCLSLT